MLEGVEGLELELRGSPHPNDGDEARRHVVSSNLGNIPGNPYHA